jgi:glycosyltransferase involved in cell wall biosynthesis
MLVALSCEVEEELLAAGFAADRIIRIPNGIDVSRFRPRDPVVFLAQGTGPTLLFVGRLHAQKNLQVLLRAAAELSSLWPNLRVVLVGDGPERGRLEGLTRDLGLEERVRFAGEVPDVLPFLHAADLFVHPSRAEGMPGALLEAMACGLPCVATRIGGTVDIITDGEDGILIPPGDDRLLAGAIGRLLGDLVLARRLGRQARTTVEARFAMDGVARRYAVLYEELVAGRRNRRVRSQRGGGHGN